MHVFIGYHRHPNRVRQVFLKRQVTKTLIDNIDSNIVDILKSNSTTSFAREPVAVSSGELFSDERFYLTGVRNKEIVTFIESNGGTVGDFNKNKTTILIKKDENYENKKTELARKSDIKIFTVDDFILQYMRN